MTCCINLTPNQHDNCNRREGKPVKWEVLALLWVTYLLNQAGRQVFNVVLPLIREDTGPERRGHRLHRHGFQPFLCPAGFPSADGRQPFLPENGSLWEYLFWSVVTMFTGLCNGFVMLVLMRSVATGGSRRSSARPTIRSGPVPR